MFRQRFFSALFAAFFLLAGFTFVHAQTDDWPREIPIENGGLITIYQPQPESLNGNKLLSRAAVSVKGKKDAEPVFGAVWIEATIQTDRDSRMISVQTVVVKQVKFPGENDPAHIEQFSKLLESEIPKWNLTMSLDNLTTSLEKSGVKSSTDLRTDPPKILYSNKIATLVLIDGEPKLEKDKDLGMEKVVNCPFPILKEGNTYYLFIGSFWYASSAIKSGWKQTTKLPAKIAKLDEQIKKQKQEQEAENKSVAAAAKEVKAAEEIIVSTEPAELIQTEGDPEYKTLEGTSLLYISNSPNDVFKDINTQKTYVLFTGRWYSSNALKGPWTYVPADQLPADFAKIKEGGDKDNVLASVAGTNAANEAVLDAMIPQTATVDRKTATVKSAPSYSDGTPQFEKIEGTSLELAVNTSSTVLRQNGMYYVVENGIWFESTKADGPWRVSTKRPTDVENIPASSAAYNTKYVEVYDVQPDVVVVGYTPGYMGSYVYGPTVIYGTGYPYYPWYGPYYYPRPVTYGFGMSYNPWTGWSMNFGMSWGPWHLGVSTGGVYFGFGFGGYCGHPGYYPPYRPPYYGGGYYGGNNHWGNNNININTGNNINIGEINVGNGDHNLYNKAGKGVNTNDIKRQPGTGNKASTMPASKPGSNTANKAGGARPEAMPSKAGAGARDVYADKSGNVFKRDQDGNWNQNSKGNNWQQTSQDRSRELNQMQQQRDRATSRDRSYQSNRAAPSRSAARPTSRPTGGVPRKR